eukprot:gnl/TRDRNA2_/TRDRNA2_73668_c1_seq1.p1 gnl/TRDRNA2_/TRDRNA2_73668_c1~~gnl/TRDRNA2_/TRDRNA2_73668_c1_seq1.p1  ORF type:complete len:405 (+),score=77.06 gnl/TRDRNA2_/TRDRNA2_73668_c1_seq1:98-1216(+)
MSAFLAALPGDDDDLPVPADHSPGENTPGLLGVLSFWEPELLALQAVMTQASTMEFGARRFYRGKIAGADVVATLTGVGISNAAMTTALLMFLYPGIERVVGGGIAGGVDPSLRVGDVTVPSRWALYQSQHFAKEVDGGYEIPPWMLPSLVGKNCGGHLEACDIAAGEASNFDFMFPKVVATPDPNAEDPVQRTTEGDNRYVWWLDADPDMLEIAKEVAAAVTLENNASGTVLDYMPTVSVGGSGISGPTFVDNVRIRDWAFDQFSAKCLDMESAASAHILFQGGKKFMFFRSLSDLAGADQDGNVMMVFFTVAAQNAFTVMHQFIHTMYPTTTTTLTTQGNNVNISDSTVSFASTTQASVLVAAVLSIMAL